LFHQQWKSASVHGPPPSELDALVLIFPASQLLSAVQKRAIGGLACARL
jgi:hypothetical protein